MIRVAVLIAVYNLHFNCFRLLWSAASLLLNDRKRIRRRSRGGVEFRQGDWAGPAVQSSRVSSPSQTVNISIHGGLAGQGNLIFMNRALDVVSENGG